MKKNKINKKIDIESEFVGNPIGPKKIRLKQNDLTKDLNNFMNNPINIDSIKDILIRIEGRFLYDKPGIFKMNIIGISRNEYIIIIKHNKYWDLKYYLNFNDLIKISSWKCENITTSVLKKDVAHLIIEYLSNNKKYVKFFEE